MKQRVFRTISMFIFTFILGFTHVSFAANPIDTSIAPMLQTVLPAVVNIKAQIKVTDFRTLQELMKRKRESQEEGGPNNQTIPNTFLSVGSGVIVDAKNGYVLTNAHVINDAQTITVTLGDGRHFTGKIIGLDSPSDVALLQIKAKNLTAITIGDSNNLKVGDFVAAIGNPFGLSQTVTSGIISALGRTTLGIENYENFIQTDAPINPGNSGGALIDAKGQLVGINTAILAPDKGSIGIGFAIPANMAKSVMRQLIAYGNVHRGILGIGAQSITPELANAFNIEDTIHGAIVSQVWADSPAKLAGIQVGDIITSVDGSPIKNSSDVVNTIGFLRVDSKINIEILRDKKPMTVTVTLTDPKKRKQIIEHMNPFLYGVGLKDFNVLSPAHGSVQGVLVVTVEEDSKAWQSDLRPGDVIISANKQKVTNVNELTAITAKADKVLLLNVLRGPSAVFLVINKDN